MTVSSHESTTIATKKCSKLQVVSQRIVSRMFNGSQTMHVVYIEESRFVVAGMPIFLVPYSSIMIMLYLYNNCSMLE